MAYECGCVSICEGCLNTCELDCVCVQTSVHAYGGCVPAALQSLQEMCGAAGGPSARFPSSSFPLTNWPVRRQKEMTLSASVSVHRTLAGAQAGSALSTPLSLRLTSPLARPRTIPCLGESPWKPEAKSGHRRGDTLGSCGPVSSRLDQAVSSWPLLAHPSDGRLMLGNHPQTSPSLRTSLLSNPRAVALLFPPTGLGFPLLPKLTPELS